MTGQFSVSDEQLGHLARRQHDLFRRVREGTLPVDEVLRGLQKIIEPPKSVATAAPTHNDFYVVRVDFSIPLARAIARCRFNGYVNTDITSDHFPPSRTGKKQVTLIELIHLNRRVTTSEALAYLEENNLRPATLEELLALGKKYPDLQLKFPIVALGSVWWDSGGCRCVPYLDVNGVRRELGLRRFGTTNRWDGDCRFAAVSKTA